MALIDQLLSELLRRGGSDLHLTVGLPPRGRISGDLQPLADEPLTPETIAPLLREICPERRWAHFEEQSDLDFAYEIPGLARFRCNYLHNHWGMAAVLRQIPSRILTFDQLGLPAALKKLCALRSGLVLVTGPTGSGKSTTLAAMIDHINATQTRHIITLEDPVEFVHPSRRSVIVHREVGEHTQSFAAGLRSAMRSDPDLILLGEMRELETIKLALNAASMGILVFGTLHTNSAPKTVDRIINAFPAEEQNQVRVLLAGCLSGIVSQLLCRKEGGGRVAAHEILLQHEALANVIRTGRISDIRAIIESGTADGMSSMDNVLAGLVAAGTISPHEAYMKALDKKRFEQAPAAAPACAASTV
ncbi:MAG: type IV pilus twitching motility protein PilT [Opitutaceae bacterium]